MWRIYERRNEGPDHPALRRGPEKAPAGTATRARGRLLLLALGGIVVLAALVIGVTKLAQAIGEYVELNTDHTVHLTDTTADKVQRIEIQGRTAVTITRRDGVYSVRELSAAVTSQSACEAAFSNAATLLAEGVAAEGVTDFAAYGLDEPVSTVNITYTDGTTLLLEIGDAAPASQHYYVRVDGGDTVYLMRPLIVEMFSEGVAAYRDLSGFAVATDGLAAFRVETGGEVFAMEHHARTGRLRLHPVADRGAGAGQHGHRAGREPGEQPVRHPAGVLCPQHDGQGAVRPGRALAHAAAHLRGRDHVPDGPGRGRGSGQLLRLL